MKLAYVVWLENLDEPILQGQVIELLRRIRITSGAPEIRLVVFQTLHHMILRHSALGRLRRSLAASRIALSVIPVVALPYVSLFRARWYLLPLIFLQSFPALLLLALLGRPDVLHCRSYPATWAALVVRRLTGVRVVFDPRSDFPEENLTAGMWDESSLTHRFWKRLERKYLREADATIAISRSYVTHYAGEAPDARFHVVPNNVDTSLFRRDEASRLDVRAGLGFAPDQVVFCYSGSIGRHWHRIDPYVRLIRALRQLPGRHGFLFVTRDEKSLRAELGRHGVPEHEYCVVRSAYRDVPRYLSAADIGTILLDRPKIAMGTKTVEYLALGLPVLTNPETQGAREIVEDFGIGAVIDTTGGMDVSTVADLMSKRAEISPVCRKVAEETFSTEAAAGRYVQLYRQLSGLAEGGQPKEGQ